MKCEGNLYKGMIWDKVTLHENILVRRLKPVDSEVLPVKIKNAGNGL
jgi:hypothetical protein